MSTKDHESDHITIWESVKVDVPEFRLYYDESGKVICYTCEKLPGNYIVIDKLTFAQGRPDIRVIDGKISTVQSHAIISKLMPDIEGTLCAVDDISIIVDDEYVGKTNKWKLTVYEL